MKTIAIKFYATMPSGVGALEFGYSLNEKGEFGHHITRKVSNGGNRKKITDQKIYLALMQMKWAGEINYGEMGE